MQIIKFSKDFTIEDVFKEVNMKKKKSVGRGSVGRARARLKKYGYKKDNFSMKFPEILEDCFKKVWRELNGGK
tara:strand:- start:494 stop:712 length:219 start_codon:yes stop_codon:yes gene_type:complete